MYDCGVDCTGCVFRLCDEVCLDSAFFIGFVGWLGSIFGSFGRVLGILGLAVARGIRERRDVRFATGVGAEGPIGATQLPEKLPRVWTAKCWHTVCALLHVLHELLFCCRDVNLNFCRLRLNAARTPATYSTITPRFSVSLRLHFRQRMIL